MSAGQKPSGMEETLASVHWCSACGVLPKLAAGDLTVDRQQEQLLIISLMYIRDNYTCSKMLCSPLLGW